MLRVPTTPFGCAELRGGLLSFVRYADCALLIEICEPTSLFWNQV